jgi:hypothetical protein
VALLVLAAVIGCLLLGGLAAGLSTRSSTARWSVIGGAGIAVLVLLGALGAVGGRQVVAHDPGSDHDVEEPRRPSGPVLRPARVELRASEQPLLMPPVIMGGLVDEQLVVMALTEFEHRSDAAVHQCPAGATARTQCRPGLPVALDAGGGARVAVDLLQVFDAADGSHVECPSGTARCSVIAFGSRRRAEIVTVFGSDGPARPVLTASNDHLSVDGVVQATVTGLTPGSSVVAHLCARPPDEGVQCGAGRAAVFADDSGRVELSVPVARPCRRGLSCTIAITGSDEARLAQPAAVVVRGRSAADYDDRRLVIGLGGAAVLLLAALVLLRRTSWTPVGGDPFAGVEIPDDPFAEGPNPAT